MVPRGGKHQHVHALPLGFGGAAQFAKLVLGLEHIDRGVAGAPEIMPRTTGFMSARVRSRNSPEGGEALGHPGTGVEQVGGGAKDGEIDLDLLAAQFLESFDRLRDTVARPLRRRRIRAARRAARRSGMRRRARSGILAGPRRARKGIVGSKPRAPQPDGVGVVGRCCAKMETQSSVRQAGTTPWC